LITPTAPAKPNAPKAALRQVYGVHGSDHAWCELYSPKTYLSDLKIPLFYSSAKLDPVTSGVSEARPSAERIYVFLTSFVTSIAMIKRSATFITSLTPSLPASKKVNSAMLAFMDQNA
jgi:hypothetical protein